MILKGIVHHIEIYVGELGRTKEFYNWLLVEKLNYSVYQIWPKGISYKLHETYLVFVQGEDFFLNNQYHRKNIGLNHVAFHMDSVDDVKMIVQEAGILKYKVLYPHRDPDEPDNYSMFLEDPDGIKIELTYNK